jgi:nitrogen regulatory protein P-II 1
MMKMIVAVIQPDRLDAVREALIKNEIYRITVSHCAGRGRAVDTEIYRGVEVVPELLPKVRLEIACNDVFVKPACEAILAAARRGDGQLGDGKIFIMPLDQCIRIRTAEQGGEAI